MQKTAIVCVSNDLTTDQRVHKICMTLQKCGYKVIEYGRLLPNSLHIQRPYITIRKKLWFRNGPQFYIELNIRLFLYILFRKVDLVIANDVDTIPGSYFASKFRKKQIIFDAHELFSEVPELTHRNSIKKIWQKIEDYFIPRIKYSYTVCSSIANYYNDKYSTDMKVVRNIPYYDSSTTKKKLSFPGKKIILYQGALNIGRGIEWVIRAMSQIENAVFVIIGDGDIKKHLVDIVNKMELSDKIIFMGRVSIEELPEFTSSADIGLCLLENIGLNYYYALPNRIFDFLHAGVPVLATRFPEIEAIVDKYNTGVLIEQYDPDFLAITINQMLKKPFNTNHFPELSKEFCWENEEKVLIEIITQVQKK